MAATPKRSTVMAPMVHSWESFSSENTWVWLRPRGTQIHHMIAWRMLLWTTLLAMATLEVEIVRTLVVVKGTTFATIVMVIITVHLEEDLRSVFALQIIDTLMVF